MKKVLCAVLAAAIALSPAAAWADNAGFVQGQIATAHGGFPVQVGTPPTNGQALIFNSATGTWIAGTPGSGVTTVSPSTGTAATSGDPTAFAAGVAANANAINSSAFGDGAQANNTSGTASSAFGHNATANGNNSLALGSGVTASGNNAVGIGLSATSNANSITINAFDTASNQFVVGRNTSVGAYVTDVYIGSGVTDPAPQSVTYHTTGVTSGTNVPSGNMQWTLGNSTGNATESFFWQAPPTGLNGTGGNVPGTIMSLTNAGNLAVLGASNAIQTITVQQSTAGTGAGSQLSVFADTSGTTVGGSFLATSAIYSGNGSGSVNQSAQVSFYAGSHSTNGLAISTNGSSPILVGPNATLGGNSYAATWAWPSGRTGLVAVAGQYLGFTNTANTTDPTATGANGPQTTISQASNGVIQIGTTGANASGALDLTSETLTGTLTLTGATVAGAPTWSSNQAITLSTASQPNITSVGTLAGLTMTGTLSMGATAAITATGSDLTVTGNSGNDIIFKSSTDGSELRVKSAAGGITVAQGALNAPTIATVTAITAGAGDVNFTGNSGNDLIFKSSTDGSELRVKSAAGGVQVVQGSLIAPAITSSAADLTMTAISGHDLIFTNSDNTSQLRVKNSTGGVTLNCKVATYNNVTTAGNGVASIPASGTLTAQAATGNITTLTPGSAGLFAIDGVLTITTTGSASMNVNVTWTDEVTTRTQTVPLTPTSGTVTTSAVSSTGPYYFHVVIRSAASAAIAVKTIGTAATAFDAYAVIEQLQ